MRSGENEALLGGGMSLLVTGNGHNAQQHINNTSTAMTAMSMTVVAITDVTMTAMATTEQQQSQCN